MYRDVVIQFRVRRAGDHLDLVTEIFERPAQVFEIHALPAAVGVAAVTEQAYFQGSVVIHGALQIQVL